MDGDQDYIMEVLGIGDIIGIVHIRHIIGITHTHIIILDIMTITH
jgi:hypothetical protein